MKIKKFFIKSIHRFDIEFTTVQDAKDKGMVFGGEAGYDYFCLTIYLRNWTILIEV